MDGPTTKIKLVPIYTTNVKWFIESTDKNDKEYVLRTNMVSKHEHKQSF